MWGDVIAGYLHWLTLPPHSCFAWAWPCILWTTAIVFLAQQCASHLLHSCHLLAALSSSVFGRRWCPECRLRWVCVHSKVRKDRSDVAYLPCTPDYDGSLVSSWASQLVREAAPSGPHVQDLCVCWTYEILMTICCCSQVHARIAQNMQALLKCVLPSHLYNVRGQTYTSCSRSLLVRINHLLVFSSTRISETVEPLKVLTGMTSLKKIQSVWWLSYVKHYDKPLAASELVAATSVACVLTATIADGSHYGMLRCRLIHE